jgi:pimeloyl-ACP methyl ester carboxylesterase
MTRRQIAISGIAVILLLFALIASFFFRTEVKRVRQGGTAKRIDIGGYKLQIDCQGKGIPVVVMDAGLANGISTWDRVLPEIAKTTLVCAYDRAGIGGSDAAPAPRTSQQIIQELDTLLEKAKVASPYVLVAHSFGALNVRLYASRHPEKVAGMVLVDPSHENQTQRFAEFMEPGKKEIFLRYEKGENPERVDVTASSMQVRSSAPIQQMPLIVITAAFEDWLPQTSQIEKARQELQAELVRLVSGGVQVKAIGSGHYVQQDRPELVIQAIQYVLKVVRSKRVESRF